MSFFTSALLDHRIASVQLAPDGQPRFYVSADAGETRFASWSETEAEGGVDADFRLFLEAQLESDDLLIDTAPGAGFLALSAATHQTATARVVALCADTVAAERLERDARSAGAALDAESQSRAVSEGLSRWLARACLGANRVFVRLGGSDIAEWVTALAEPIASGRVVALLIDPATNTADLVERLESLEAVGYRAHVLATAGEETVLVAATTTDATSALIALHAAAAADDVAEPDLAEPDLAEPDVTAPDLAAPDLAAREPLKAEIAPSVAEQASWDAAIADLSSAVAPAYTASFLSAITQTRPARPRDLKDSSFLFAAPFCRTGYGVAGAQFVRALLALRADVGYLPIGAVDQTIAEVPRLNKTLRRGQSLPRVVPSVRLSQQFDLLAHEGEGPKIGFPIFELDRFTETELMHLRAQDRLLVCSAWARGVLEAHGLGDRPIDLVPLGVDRSTFHEHVPPVHRSSDTVFLQVGKIEPRKGQLELLTAFERAFSPNDGVRLVLHCHNPFLSAAALDELLAPFRRSPMAHRIELHTTPLPTQSAVARAMRSADCGVFCSKAEGWNLEALEMLSVGKPIIATRYSAHTEFLDDRNARLVDIDGLEARGVGSWAALGERQLEQMVSHLRAVHVERQQAGELPVNQAGIVTAQRYSWTQGASAMLQAVAAAW